MSITKQLRELLQGDSLSRKEILLLLDEIDENYNIMKDQVNDFSKENQAYAKSLETSDERV